MIFLFKGQNLWYNNYACSAGDSMKIELTEWRPSFAEALAKSANDERIALFLRDCFPNPYYLSDARQFINFARSECEKGDYYRAIVVQGQPAGSISAVCGRDVFRRSAELGYWLAPQYWNCGIMTEAVRIACEQVFGTDIIRIFAEPFSDNIASCRVLEKNGFVREGVLRKSVFKNGAFHDSSIYARIRLDG